MKKPALIVPLVALALAACSERAEDHADRTGNAIAADVERASDNVVRSVDSLTDAIGDRVANRVDGLAADQLDRAADRIDAASERLEDEVRRRADTARDRTGTALENAGNDLRRGTETPDRAPARDER